jgi:hypothetical protein
MNWRKDVSHPAEGKHPGFAPRSEEDGDILIERDVAAAMRDGTKLYVDIFRPSGQADVPIILTYSPYGKHGLKKFLLGPKSGVPGGWVSPYAAWEAPDPAYFVREGYAVINADARGSWYSEGDLTIWSDQEALDGYDLIEWAAALPWGNGKVGMSGVSYLAIVQWRIAALNPPSLAAINPWEGWTDYYRERAYHGGIPETNMVAWAQWSTSFGLNRSEELVETTKQHPLLDEFAKSKSADLAAIKVPAYVVADWGDQGLHLRGTIEGFRQMSSGQKWLEVHGRKKWQYYYQAESRDRLRVFFDHFLRGTSDEVLSWPRVSIEVRERYYVGEVRAEHEWPLSRQVFRRLYLDASSRELREEIPAEAAIVAYNAASGSLEFEHTFTERTELTGYMNLKLWIGLDGASDADVFVAVEKLDREGDPVKFTFMSEYDDGPVALGWLRVSHREMDPVRSTPDQPWHLHERELPVGEGDIVPVEIEIWPSSTLFEAGQRLQLIIQGSDIYKFDGVRHSQRHLDLRNAGNHVIHTGGDFDSSLLVPVIPG